VGLPARLHTGGSHHPLVHPAMAAKLLTLAIAFAGVALPSALAASELSGANPIRKVVTMLQFKAKAEIKLTKL
jgi:hypothetical protein